MTRITPDAVMLASGESASAGLAGGVRPVLDHASGLVRSPEGRLAADRSLMVAKLLWAAGDIATPQGWPGTGHWRLAHRHGQAAAPATLGQPAAYQGVPFIRSAQPGKRLDLIGHASKRDGIVLGGDAEGFAFSAWRIWDGVEPTVLTCAHDRATARLSRALKSRLPLSEARQLAA